MLRIISIAIIALSLNAFSINASEHIPVDQLTTEWQLDKDIDGVQIYLRKVECHDDTNDIHKEVILVRMINTTQNSLTVEWDMEFWFEGKCYTCDESSDDEYHYAVNLPPGSDVEGSCRGGDRKTLQFYVRMLKLERVPQLTTYEMANLRVSLK